MASLMPPKLEADGEQSVVVADGIPPEPEVAAEFLADVQGEDPPVNVQSQVQVHQRAPKVTIPVGNRAEDWPTEVKSGDMFSIQARCHPYVIKEPAQLLDPQVKESEKRKRITQDVDDAEDEARRAHFKKQRAIQKRERDEINALWPQLAHLDTDSDYLDSDDDE